MWTWSKLSIKKPEQLRKSFLFFMVNFWQVSNIGLKSSYRMCSIKKAVLKNLATLIGKHLHWSLASIIWRHTSGQLHYKVTPTQVFSCEYCEIFINIYFKGHLWMTASELDWFKVKDIVIEKTDVFRDDNQRCIQNPMEHLRWNLLQK